MANQLYCLFPADLLPPSQLPPRNKSSAALPTTRVIKVEQPKDTKQTGTQEEAAEAYDIAAIKFRGVNAVTNFDITIYDVERIIGSNTLLAGELAKRNKEIEHNTKAVDQPSTQDCTTEPGLQEEDGHSEWKMVLSPFASQESIPTSDPCGKQQETGNYMNGQYSWINNMNSVQQGMSESSEMATRLSNNSSVVTTMSNSREGSPDKRAPAMPFSKVPKAPKSSSPAKASNHLLPSPQLKPRITMSHMPVFAAWADT